MEEEDKAKEQLRLVTDALPVLISYVDSEQRYRLNNRAYEEWFGRSRTEMLGKHIKEVLGESAYEAILKYIEAALSGEKVTFEGAVPYKDGGTRYISATYIPHFGEKGEVKGFFALVNDITDRKQWEEELRRAHDQLEMRVQKRTAQLTELNEKLRREIAERKRVEEKLRAAEERYRNTLDNMMEGCQIIGYDWRYLYVNDAVARHGRRAKEELLGHTMMETYPGIENTKMFAYLRRCMDKRLPHRMENKFTFPDGSQGWFELSIQPVPEGIFILSADITERKRAEEALRESEEKYKALFEQKLDGVVVIDETLKPVLANQAAAQIMGFDSVEELLEVNPFDYIQPEERERVLKIMTKDMFKNNLRQVHEIRCRKKSGEEIWIGAVGTLIVYQGKLAGLCSFSDITERKRVEEELRAAEQNFRNSLDSSPLGIRIVTAEGETIYANQAILDICGYCSIEELKATPLRKIYTPESYAQHLERKEKRKQGKFIPIPYRISIVRKDGEVRHLEVFHKEVLWGGETQFQVIYQDITERKRAEAEVKRIQERFSGLYNSSKDAIGFANNDGTLLDVNDAFCQLTGYSRKELLAGKKYQELTPEEYHEWEAKLVEGVLTTGKPAEYEKEYIRKDGSRIPILLTVFVVKGEGGKPIGVAAIIKDITERKQAEDTLRQSEEKYKSLVSNVKLGVFRSTPEPLGKFLEVNPAMEEITGYHRKELLQMSVADLYVYPDERRLVLEEVASGKGRRTREVRLRKKDGTEILVLVRKVAVRDDADRILYFDGIMEDVTERKQAEEKEKELQKELNLASRLASVGQLAAGVAHEINNPLTAILAFSQRLLRKSTDDKVKRNLEIIHNEARRAAKVVENLLTFARRREPKIGYSNVNDILCRALELRAYELKTSNIKVVTDLAPSLPRVRVDFYQIEEVFLSIIVNAEQAMSEANGGGKLGIKTRETDGYIRVSFTDDGPGIPVEHSDKVFDPFFTTRGKKGGTGLGLSICHGIVQRHGGKIYVRSKPGKGATFVVELPIATKR